MEEFQLLGLHIYGQAADTIVNSLCSGDFFKPATRAFMTAISRLFTSRLALNLSIGKDKSVKFKSHLDQMICAFLRCLLRDVLVSKCLLSDLVV